MTKYPSVLHIIDSLEPGGAEQVAITLANIFQEKCHHVGLLYFNKTEVNLSEQISSGVELLHFERRMKYNPLVSTEIKYYINKFDIMHIHLRYNLKYYSFLNFFHRFNKPVFFHDHFGNIERDKSIDFFEKYFMKSTVYICVSNILMNWANKNGLNKVFLLENIITREKILNSNDYSNRIIIVGNIQKRKNQLFAIRLIKRIFLKKNVSLDIYGQILDSKYYRLLKNYIHNNNLENNVRFIFNCTQIQKILHKYTLAIHCSTSETGPLVLLEYMAQGLPFLTNNTGQVINHFKRDLPFFILNDFSIDHWLNAMELVQSKPQKELRGKMINIFNQICSPDIYYKKCLRIYTENIP